MPTVSSKLTASVVGILNLKSQIVGTGFIVGERTILTCAHVVQQAGGAPGQSLVVRFHLTGETRTVWVEMNTWRESEKDDVAVLQLEETIPTNAIPLMLGYATGCDGHLFRAFGYPVVGNVQGLWSTGQIKGLVSDTSGKALLQIASREVARGMSGGPVLDETTGFVVGMVTATYHADSSHKFDDAGFATPAEVLRTICPGLPEPMSQKHFFISYRRHVERDKALANYLYATLTAHGHTVFIDASMRTGTAWLEEIDQQIRASDFIIALISKESADSEMVQAEVRRAYEYRKIYGQPHTLPVRVAYEGLLPYTLDAFINPLQYVVWHSADDNERVGQEILAVAAGRSTPSAPITPVHSTKITLSEDGRALTNSEAMPAPLPEFDPRFLDELEAPGGAVKLRDHFYVEREADARLKRELLKAGTTTTIRASRQTGKSSLLVRSIHHVRTQAKVVHLDLQSVDHDYLSSADAFLKYLAGVILRKLRLDVNVANTAWRDSLGPQDKLTHLLEDHVLPNSPQPIILALDEADRLLETTFYSDFFALLRSWHNNRALDETWQQLSLVMVISTEPYLLIADINQSPFNVGLKLYLEDFTEPQARGLNQQHGSPVRDADFAQFMDLLSGHPYLTRKAFYTLVVEKLAWPELVRGAVEDQGPFGDHLRRQHWLLRNEPKLQEALRQVIRSNRCDDDQALFRLLRAGLVRGSGNVYTCRCDLYMRYFKDKLK